MSGMDGLRERIARALWDHGERESQKWLPGGPLVAWEEVPADDSYRRSTLAQADAVIAELGLVEEVSLGLGWRGDGIARRCFVTEWKPIVEECQCGADITHRDEHHRQSVCVRASGHSGAHDDGQGCVWTGGNQ